MLLLAAPLLASLALTDAFGGLDMSMSAGSKKKVFSPSRLSGPHLSP